MGEWVLAIARPLALKTATMRVVSAKGRSLPDDSLVPFIQTDVAVNPGNWGSAVQRPWRGGGHQLADLQSLGRLPGVSFSHPHQAGRQDRDQIVATGKVRHAQLGVAVQEVNQAFAEVVQPRQARRRAGGQRQQEQPG